MNLYWQTSGNEEETEEQELTASAERASEEAMTQDYLRFGEPMTETEIVEAAEEELLERAKYLMLMAAVELISERAECLTLAA